MGSAVRFPLVGRDEELDRMARLRREARSSIILAGAPGVGKTRLLTETVARAKADGWWVERTVASRAAASIPFGPLAHLLDAVPAGPPDRLAILHLLGNTLTERAQGRPLLLAVDDGHLLDQGSAAFVHHLAASRKGLVVVTLRTGEATPDAVTLLWKDGLAERIEVQTLSQQETETLITTALGGPVATETLHRLWETTRGNALLLRELLLAARDQGSLAKDGGVWQWRGPTPPTSRLVEITQLRLAGLGAGARDALDALAVAESLGVSLLEDVAGPHATELEEHGLIVVESDDRRVAIRLSHPLYGEIVRDGMSVLRRREVERRLAEVYERAGGRRRDDLLRIATWRLHGGGSTPPQMLLAAAQRSIVLLDLPLAERLARAAEDAGAGFDAVMLRIQAVIGLGRFDEAEALFERLAELAADDAQRASAVVLHAEHLFWRAGRVDEAFAMLDRTASLDLQPDSQAEIAGVRARLSLFSGQTAEAWAQAQGVFSDPTRSPRARLQAAPTLVFGLALAGRRDDACAIGQQALALVAASVEDADLENWIQTNIAAANSFSGHLREAQEQVTALYQRAQGSPSRWHTGIMAWPLGQIARLQGRCGDAVAHLRESIGVLREIDLLNNLPTVLAELARTLALLGDGEEAQAVLDEATARRVTAFRMDEVFLAGAHVWVLAAQGAMAAAAQGAIGTAHKAAELGQHALEAAALHDAARLGAAAHAASRLTDLAAQLQGPAFAAFAAHARALVEEDGGGLDASSRRFADIGMNLHAAEAATAAARAHDAAGDRRSAAAASAQARTLLDRCQGARTPATAAVTSSPLTTREHEIAVLAAKGLSSKQIAERLVLSVRTVDNHLQRTYVKLGTTSRKELAAVLLEPDQRSPTTE